MLPLDGSDCRVARVAKLWGQSGANKQFPGALKALKVPENVRQVVNVPSTVRVSKYRSCRDASVLS
jgi:hypothetical protein